MADERHIPVDDNLSRIFKTLLIFTLMMVTIPIFLYFFTKSFVFNGVFGMSDMDSLFYAAIVAIIAVHVVLGLIIYTAWTEDRGKKIE